MLCLLKDGRGYVWCGTWLGLSRFNGETFENYTAREGLWQGSINSICEDAQGYIWLLGGNGQLARFDGKTFKKYKAPNRLTGSLLVDKANHVQVLDDQHRLMQVSGDTVLPINLPHQPPGIVHNVLYHHASKRHVFQIDNHLYSYQLGSWQLIYQGKHLSDLVSIHQSILFKEADETGKAATIFVWDGNSTSPFLRYGPAGISVLKTQPYDFIFSHNSQLYRIPARSLRFDWVCADPPLVTKAFLDQPASALLWLPTEKGLWGLVRNGFKAFSPEQVPYVWSVVEDRKGGYFFMNFHHSLQYFDGKKLTTVPVSTYRDAANKLLNRLKLPPTTNVNDWYFRALRDHHGTLWLPNVLGVLHNANNQWNLTRPATQDPIAFAIAEDPRRNKIVCASNGFGYTIANQPPFQTKLITGKDPLFDHLLLCIAVAPDSRYWFSGLGVVCYDPDTGQFRSYNQQNGKLPTRIIQMLYFDWAGTLWAGGREGLYRFNRQCDCFEPFLPKQFPGLIQFVEQIDRNHLLISDAYSLYILDLTAYNQTNTVQIRCFNHHNGFMGLEPGQLGSYRDSKGTIWITSGSVLSRFDPRQVNLHQTPLRTFITKLHLKDSTFRVPFRPDTAIIKLPFGQNEVSLAVEAVGEDKPFRSQFSYRLEGVNSSWSRWQESNQITLTNLPNGVHTVQVRSRAGTLSSTESSSATIQFQTSVFFWRSPGFYAYAFWIGLVLLLTLLYAWWRQYKQQEQNLRQQQQLNQQENKVRYLQIQTIQAQMNPHFTFNVLGTIQHLIANNEPQQASASLLKLSHLIRNYLEASLLSDSPNGSLFAHEISLAKEVELLRMYIEFEQLQYGNLIQYDLTIDGKLNPENYRVPPLLLQPYVENAIKHGLLYKEEPGHLWIRFISIDDDALICTIEDDGVGREQAGEIQRTSFKKYKSRGTELIKRRVDILNQMGYAIRIQTNDRLAGGTVVTVQIGYQ
ncbi:histidine kinase [Spirosoma telluris]|uniref:histidine kinase n=1 Tax=Spirosoma telluris TaxID=2183553 RepID=UPI001314FC67